MIFDWTREDEDFEPNGSKFIWYRQCKIIIIIIIIINIIGIQPLGRSGQRPEFSQATGMALVRCILGKFLGIVCHCFPPV